MLHIEELMKENYEIGVDTGFVEILLVKTPFQMIVFKFFKLIYF